MPTLLLQKRRFCPSGSAPAAAPALTQVRAGELCFTAWDAFFSAIKTQPHSVSQTSAREGGLYLSWFCLPSINRKINGLCSFIEEKKVLFSHLGGLMGYSGVQHHFSGVPTWSLLMKVFNQLFMLLLGHEISGSGTLLSFCGVLCSTFEYSPKEGVTWKSWPKGEQCCCGTPL